MDSGRLSVDRPRPRTGKRIHRVLAFSVPASVLSDFWNDGEAPVGTTGSSEYFL